MLSSLEEGACISVRLVDQHLISHILVVLFELLPCTRQCHFDAAWGTLCVLSNLCIADAFHLVEHKHLSRLYRHPLKCELHFVQTALILSFQETPAFDAWGGMKDTSERVLLLPIAISVCLMNGNTLLVSNALYRSC